MSSWFQRSDQQRPKRPSNNHVKEVGTPPMRSNLCDPISAVSTAVRSKVTKTVSEKQLLRNNTETRQLNHPAMRAQLHLPALDLSWDLGISCVRDAF